jgi:thymidylate kinase
MRLITISGLDGSGKSTQIKKLEKYLGNKNLKVKYFHAIDFSIANKWLFSNKNKLRNKRKPKAITSANRFQIFLRKIALLADVFRFRKYFLILSRENTTDFLLADRYFYDQIINILYLEKKLPPLPIKLPPWLKIAYKYIITPDLKIYLSVSPEKIIARSRIEQGIKYLINKEKLYNHLTKRWQIKKIDGERKQEEIFADILKEYENING